MFLKLGIIGFGGPAAHIALMEDEVVRRRAWLTREKFLDLLGATNLIPGPNSTEMAIHIGYLRAGVIGLLVAGACFILPAMLIVLGCAWAYVHFGTLPQAQAILYGVKPVVIAIILQALWKLAGTAVKTPLLGFMGAAAVILNFIGMNELLILVLTGFACITFTGLKRDKVNSSAATLLGVVVPAGTVASVGTAFGLWPMFLFFLKTGSVLFGSGYVLLAFLRADLVERWHWLTDAQLLDAIAVGQITPGPVFTTATFVGYLLGGTPAAILATIAIFLPAFFFVAISGPLVPRIRRSKLASAFLDGVNVASLALMTVVTYRLGHASLIDLPTVGLTLLSALVLWRFRVNSAWLIVGGALIGLLAGRG